ncbi:MAG: phage major capsid protein [Aeromicrobium sp.]
MITYLTRLTSERDSLTEAATELATRAASEERDLSETEQTSMRAWQERCAQIDTQLTEYSAQAESQRAYARLRESFNREDEPQQRAAVELHRADAAGVSWGDAFINSGVLDGYQGRGASEQVMVPGPFEERAEITSGLPAPWVVPPYVYNPATFRYQTPVLDVVGKITTGLSAVQWLQWTPNPVAKAPVVPEATAKPEMVLTPVAQSDSLDTYAHWKGITRQALDDIPQIRSIVEGKLREGIMRALEDAVLAAIVAADAAIPDVDGGTSALGGIRAAVGQVQGAGYASPNAVLLNPADFAALDVGIMTGSNSGPSQYGNYWGLRPIAVPAVPSGTAWVGDFATGVQLYTRGQTALYMTDSHADYFIKNIVLLLAETRALATVPDPLALAKVTYTLPAPVGAQAAPQRTA